MKRITYFLLFICFQIAHIKQVSATTFSVVSSNFAFTPNTLTISSGDEVAFTNAGGFHFVQWLTAPGALPPDSGTLTGTPQNYTFTTVGTYTYQCGIHGSSMKGSITVSIVPIELRSFAVEPKANGLLLTWVTESEANTAFFSLERAQADNQFQEIGTLKAAGESKRSLQYTFEDVKPPFGNLYYRLKTVDFDQSFKYSPIIAIQMLKAYTVKVYPNPTSHIVSFEWFIPDSHHIDLNVIDLSGKVVAGPFVLHQHHGLSRFDLDVSTFANGTYMTILDNHQNFQQPLHFVVNH